MTRFQAVIFDLDGTLIETERMVVEAGVAAMVGMGFPARADILVAMVGSVDSPEAMLRAAFGAEFDFAAFDRGWQAEMDRAYAAGVPLRPGVSELLHSLDAMAMPRAVATNSLTGSARANLTAAGIVGFFAPENIHGRDQVRKPKPAPDLFLLAARGLGIDPVHCLVFEDSDPGAAGALAAGMTVVQIPDQRPVGNRDVHLIAESLMGGARDIGLL